MVRSSGGDKRDVLARKKDEREEWDERILGSGEFACPVKFTTRDSKAYFTGVNETLHKAGQDWKTHKKPTIQMDELIAKVASHLHVSVPSVLSSSRKQPISEARSLISYLAINKFGYCAADVGRALSINRVNANRCALRGEGIITTYEGIYNQLGQ